MATSFYSLTIPIFITLKLPFTFSAKFSKQERVWRRNKGKREGKAQHQEEDKERQEKRKMRAKTVIDFTISRKLETVISSYYPSRRLNCYQKANRR